MISKGMVGGDPVVRRVEAGLHHWGLGSSANQPEEALDWDELREDPMSRVHVT